METRRVSREPLTRETTELASPLKVTNKPFRRPHTEMTSKCKAAQKPSARAAEETPLRSDVSQPRRAPKAGTKRERTMRVNRLSAAARRASRKRRRNRFGSLLDERLQRTFAQKVWRPMSTSYEIQNQGPSWSFHPYWGRGIEWSNEPDDDSGATLAAVPRAAYEISQMPHMRVTADDFSVATGATVSTVSSLPWYPQPGTGCS